ncbi:hypothetical protein GCM10025868_47150 [Angustibacter aerolatus]|uniref:Uncharacterized protein n=1 Tax=Angustibacter aerolatus TaxID=1162965 RepID=A0ABQ6JQC1_9ACTN|nr:hypothetical protein GCM10025868_47150 [Angustibacter aerolatus]
MELDRVEGLPVAKWYTHGVFRSRLCLVVCAATMGATLLNPVTASALPVTEASTPAGPITTVTEVPDRESLLGCGRAGLTR